MDDDRTSPPIRDCYRCSNCLGQADSWTREHLPGYEDAVVCRRHDREYLELGTSRIIRTSRNRCASYVDFEELVKNRLLDARRMKEEAAEAAAREEQRKRRGGWARYQE